MSSSKKIEDILFHSYYSVDSPGGFSTPERLLNFVRKNYNTKITKNHVIDWLQKQRTYTLHKDRRIRFKRNHYTVSNIDDLWEMDLIDMQKVSRLNKGFRYILAVIDCFSRYAWCIPIKRKTPAEVIKAYETLFSSTNRMPIQIQSDKGKEFVNTKVEQYFLSKSIKFYTTRDPVTKAAICERFIRTIKGLIYKYFTFSKKAKYVDVLNSLVFLYNNRIHSSIGIAPCDVSDDNVLSVWMYMRKKYETDGVKKNKYVVGDMVRVSNQKSTFEKGYKPKWSDETFTVVRVLRRRPVVYNIKDEEGDLISANFYENELQKVN